MKNSYASFPHASGEKRSLPTAGNSQEHLEGADSAGRHLIFPDAFTFISPQSLIKYLIFSFGAGSVGPAAFGLGMRDAFLTILVVDIM
jgi:hypothetical protein